MPQMVADKLLSWAVDAEPEAIRQAARSARMPFVDGHVALMPDVHYGIGATVGSVIPTKDTIMPAAVGVDIGCGMIATEFDFTASSLPYNLNALMSKVEERIPAGVGKGHSNSPTDVFANLGYPRGSASRLTSKQEATAESQFGTLGSGNHFVEICLDERDHVWTVLHSGSRGIGNQLATYHIKTAKAMMKKLWIALEDPDLAYFVQGQQEFTNYIDDMLWAQQYAMASRQAMANALNVILVGAVGGKGHIVRQINCHHNFTQKEHHNGKDLWITRKGAIKASVGDFGVIPGSMGTQSYIVSGLGNTSSYASCAHGAGRRMSRTRAKAELTVESLEDKMSGKTWNANRASHLLDEHPDAYKDIDQVMEAQKDLVRIEHTLRQVFNYKG